MYFIEFVIFEESCSNPIIEIKSKTKFINAVNNIEKLNEEDKILFSGFCINLGHIAYLRYFYGKNNDLLNLVRGKDNRVLDIELDSERIKREEKEEIEKKVEKNKKVKTPNIISLEDYDNLV